MKTNRHLLKPCSHCKNSEKWIIVETTNANGSIVYPYYCSPCWHRGPIVEKKLIAHEVGYEHNS